MRSELKRGQEITEREYPMGNRLDVLKWTAAVIIAVLSMIFYFIYQFLLEPIAPAIIGTPLAVIFLVICLAMIAADFALVKLYRKRVCYRVTGDALEYVRGKRIDRYFWKDFTHAEQGRIRPGILCPIVFTVQGQELTLNPYTRSVYGLAADILRKIERYADIEPDLIRSAEAMSDL